jgi:hypothetical protein
MAEAEAAVAVKSVEIEEMTAVRMAVAMAVIGGGGEGSRDGSEDDGGGAGDGGDGDGGDDNGGDGSGDGGGGDLVMAVDMVGTADKRGGGSDTRAARDRGVSAARHISVLTQAAKGEWSTIFHVYKAPPLHLFGKELNGRGVSPKSRGV